MVKNKNKMQAYSAVMLTDVISGLDVPITKLLLDEWVSPMGYVFTRCLGTAVIFWLISPFMPKEPIEREGLSIIVLGGLPGSVVSQALTAWVLVYTTPACFSLIATLTPVAIMLMTAASSKETLNGREAIGVLISIAGALLMVFMGWQDGSGTNDMLGIFLTVLSLLAWVIYLPVTRNVPQKYSAVTQMKWIFLISTIAVLPFAAPEWGQQKLLSAAWAWTGVTKMVLIVLSVTVMGYFATPFAMRYLSTTAVNIYINLQPVVVSLVAIYIGQDVLTWDKPVAGTLVLPSAYIITRKNVE